MMKIAHWTKQKLKSLRNLKKQRKDWKGTRWSKTKMKIYKKNRV